MARIAAGTLSFEQGHGAGAADPRSRRPTLRTARRRAILLAERERQRDPLLWSQRQYLCLRLPAEIVEERRGSGV
jgi:hypothetical protein